jgi:biopolymer transport protein ExbD
MDQKNQNYCDFSLPPRLNTQTIKPMAHTKRVMPELNSGAMADIAFLLLTFYMVTTEIKDNKGLALMLPPYAPETASAEVNNRNLFAIKINSSNGLMVEGKEVHSLSGLRTDIKKFILNYAQDPTLSDSPADAVVSIKTDRGTSYKSFIAALDEAQAAYYEIYAERVGLSSTTFRALDLSNPEDKKMYDKARQGIPMNISIAEPTAAQQ